MRAGPGVPVAVALLLAVPPAAHAVWPPWYRPDLAKPRYQEILVDAAWLAARRRDATVTVVDARSVERFERSHVAGARSFDASGPLPETAMLAARLAAAGIPSSGTVVCYSDAADPAAAGRLFWLLELAGHSRARVLNGGFEAWRRHRGAVEQGPARARAARFTARADTSKVADHAYVIEVLWRPGHTLMDWRAPADWDRGHVPHSLPFPLEKLVRPDGTTRDGPGMRLSFEEFGPRRGDYVDLTDEFVVFGDAPPGATPIDPYLAARVAGIARVRRYPEGFSGWSGNPDAPITRIVSAEELRRHLGGTLWDRLRRIPPRGVILFDLRGDREHAWGHLPGAVSLPSWSFERDLDSVVTRHWPNADRATVPLVVYCYGPDCVRSRNCTTAAARHGFRNLWWFRDGIPGWQAAGLALEKSK